MITVPEYGIDFKKWKILEHMGEEFLSDVKLAYFFGFWGGRAFLVDVWDQVYSIGDTNPVGVLGIPISQSSKNVANVVNELSGKAVIDFAAGFRHTLALTKTGLVYSWGSNYLGQLGLGRVTPPREHPQLVTSLTRVRRIAAGIEHSVALDALGQVWCWGDNRQGQCGFEPKLEHVTEATRVPLKLVLREKITSIVAGGFHTVCLSNRNVVYVFGSNDRGQLGDASVTGYSHVPVPHEGLGRVVEIASGYRHVLVLNDQGSVYSWGENVNKVLGVGHPGERVDSPRHVLGLPSAWRVMASMRYNISVAETNGGVYAWGVFDIKKPEDTFQPRVVEARNGLEYMVNRQVGQAVRIDQKLTKPGKPYPAEVVNVEDTGNNSLRVWVTLGGKNLDNAPIQVNYPDFLLSDSTSIKNVFLKFCAEETLYHSLKHSAEGGKVEFDNLLREKDEAQIDIKNVLTAFKLEVLEKVEDVWTPGSVLFLLESALLLQETDKLLELLGHIKTNYSLVARTSQYKNLNPQLAKQLTLYWAGVLPATTIKR